MFEPKHTIIKRYLTWTFIMIVFLLISGIAVANDNFYTKILPIEPDEVNGQYCFIKVTIKQKGDEIITAANTAIPTISAIINAGGKPRLVDVGEDYLIDIISLLDCLLRYFLNEYILNES